MNWEYFITGTAPAYLEAELQIWGAAGWELVTVTQRPYIKNEQDEYFQLVFKRPIESQKMEELSK